MTDLRRRVRPPALPIAPLVLVLASCGGEGVQSILHPYGIGARSIAGLWWLLFVLGTAIFLAVLGLMLWAVLRRRGERAAPRDAPVVLWLGIGGLAIPIVVLAVTLVATLSTMRRQADVEAAIETPSIKVVGHQWWWEVEYQDPVPQRILTTANEIAIPVGRPVRIELESRDVIHSFWVPNLQSKTDLIPGRTNTTWIQADEAGLYRGQCAEFCGVQHANMAFTVHAMPEEEYEAWYEARLQPAAEPQGALAQEGRRVFLEKACSSCHSVRGTMALASFGPDLTHVGSRPTLAAGTLPNTRGHLGGWISDPQGIKPGSLMPQVDLASQELLALVAFLEDLE